MARRSPLLTLAVAVETDGDKLPTEVRLFKAGENETEKGTFLFDEKAAELVMAAYQAHGVDRMFDLEHLSLDEDAPNFDPDARAWCKLEVRDGELWAVDISWTEDGARRLREKTQRYVSPAFATDDEDRVVKIINIALTALPATWQTPALVAARARTRDCRKLSGASFQDIQRSIQEALSKRHPSSDDGPYVPGPWIRDVFDDSVVYEYDGKLWQCGYSYSKGDATLGAETQVVQTYVPAESAARTNPLRALRGADVIALALRAMRSRRNAHAS